MKSKTTVVLLLLSIFSVYFLCPVLCSLPGTRTCGASTAEQTKSQAMVSVSQYSEIRSSSSPCCRTKKSETTPDDHSDEEKGNCCPDHLGILKASEYQRSSQTSHKSSPLVAVIIPLLAFPVSSTHSAIVLNSYPNPVPDPPSHQISPRAPPFFLA